MPSYIIGHTIRQSAGSGLHIEQGLSATCILVSQDLAVRFADETLNREHRHATMLRNTNTGSRAQDQARAPSPMAPTEDNGTEDPAD